MKENEVNKISANSVVNEDFLDDSFEEIDWFKYGKILTNFDPVPNYTIFNTNDANLRETKNVMSFDLISPIESYWCGQNEIVNLMKKFFSLSDNQGLIDNYSKILLSKLFKQNLIKKIDGIIGIGEKSFILHAIRRNDEECVIKVFRTPVKKITISRSAKEEQVCRKVLQMQAKHEVVNLIKLKEAGVTCPDVINLKKHIVVMSFVGKEQIGAPTLSNARLTIEEYQNAFAQIVDGMVNSYVKAHLVLVDLSENNILWHNKQCYFIDVGKSVQLNNENSDGELRSSCQRIVDFFNDREVPNMVSANEVYMRITGKH